MKLQLFKLGDHVNTPDGRGIVKYYEIKNNESFRYTTHPNKLDVPYRYGVKLLKLGDLVATADGIRYYWSRELKKGRWK